jgi:hypothetical protein
MPSCRIKPPARCPVNLSRGTMFRLVGACYYRSVVCARRLLCAWKVRSGLGVLSHFWSPLSASLMVPNTNLGPGEIFRTDFTGGGTVQDLVPGTRVGSFDRGINASNINTVLTEL